MSLKCTLTVKLISDGVLNCMRQLLSKCICTICYLNLKEEPLVNKTGLGLGLGSSYRRKKA